MNISDVPDTLNDHHRPLSMYASVAAVIVGCVLVMFAGPMLVMYALGVLGCGIAAVVWWEAGQRSMESRSQDERAAVLTISEHLGFHVSRKNLAQLRESWENDEAPFWMDVDVYSDDDRTISSRRVILTAAGELVLPDVGPEEQGNEPHNVLPHTTQT